MVAIVFPTSSDPTARPQESAGRLINCFVDKTDVGAPGATIWRRSAGFNEIFNTGNPRVRGMSEFIVGPAPFLELRRCYVVQSGVINEVTVNVYAPGAYSITNIASIPGTGPVTIAINNRSPDRDIVVIARGNGAFWGDTRRNWPAGWFNSNPVPNLAGTPTSCCDMDGYVVYSYDDGRIAATDLNSLNLNSLSFNTEQGQAVMRVLKFAGRLFAMGNKWTAVYRNAGTVPFPFLREATIGRGLLGTHAVAGWEPGWSNELIWVGEDFVVYKLNGLNPVPISNDSISRMIQKAVSYDFGIELSSVTRTNRDLFEAFVYMFGKNPIWVLKFTPPGTTHFEKAFTVEYNLATGQWNERRSYTEYSWRAHRSTRAPNGWLVGDHNSGQLHQIQQSYFAESGFPYTWTIESGVMTGFPIRTVIPRASFNITAGVGDLTQPTGPGLNPADPVVRISWSLDGGHTWGLPVTRKLGAPGETNHYPYVISSGISRGQGIRYRLEVTDPVHVGLSGGEIDVQQRAPNG